MHFHQPARAFALRFDGRVVAYLNRCAHVPTEMDWQPGQFLVQPPYLMTLRPVHQPEHHGYQTRQQGQVDHLVPPHIPGDELGCMA